MFSYVTVIFLFSFLFGRSDLIAIKTFDGYPGFHFEETGSIRLYKGEWKILTNVNLTKYKDVLDKTRNNVKLIKNCCEEFEMVEIAKNLKVDSDTSFTTFISPALNKLDIAMTNLEDNFNNMFRFKPKLILNDWYEDQIYIEDEFKSVEGVQTRTETIIKIFFIESILNSIASSFAQHNDDCITDPLSFIQSKLSAVKNGSENAEQLFDLRNTIDIVIHVQTAILSSFKLLQEQYGNIVSLVGHRNPKIGRQLHILRSDTVTNELNNIREILSQTGLELHTKITSKNLFSFFQSPDVQMVNDQIYITFRIPILSKPGGSSVNDNVIKRWP